MTQLVRVISLGEIVTPNDPKVIPALAGIIISKNPKLNIIEIQKALGGVLGKNMELINKFKMGNEPENEFDEKMITAIENATGVRLDVQEFNQGWSAMHPALETFKNLLQQAIDFNSKKDQKIIFVSFTNVKDIKALSYQLAFNTDWDVKWDDSKKTITNIGGIELHTSYAENKSKVELISDQVAIYRNPNSINSVDLKYIRSVNKIDDPVLNQDLVKENRAIDNLSTIETIFWRKFEKQPFNDALYNVLSKFNLLAVNNL